MERKRIACPEEDLYFFTLPFSHGASKKGPGEQGTRNQRGRRLIVMLLKSQKSSISTEWGRLKQIGNARADEVRGLGESTIIAWEKTCEA